MVGDLQTLLELSLLSATDRIFPVMPNFAVTAFDLTRAAGRFARLHGATCQLRTTTIVERLPQSCRSEACWASVIVTYVSGLFVTYVPGRLWAHVIFHHLRTR